MACALFLIGAFSLAGLAHSLWLRWPASGAFAYPLDAHRTVRRRRLLGDNKTVRGFMVMIPATGFSFWALAHLVEVRTGDPGVVGLWALDPRQYALLGLWTGFGFMLAELPNSFLKRQLDVAPGAAPEHPVAKPVCFLLDRFDSILGLLLAAALVVPTPWELWVLLLLAGSVVHWLFSVLLFALGVKERPA